MECMVQSISYEGANNGLLMPAQPLPMIGQARYCFPSSPSNPRCVSSDSFSMQRNNLVPTIRGRMQPYRLLPLYLCSTDKVVAPCFFMRSSMVAVCCQVLFRVSSFLDSSYIPKERPFSFVISQPSMGPRSMPTVHLFVLVLFFYSCQAPVIAMKEIPEGRRPHPSEIRIPPVRSMSCRSQNPPVIIADCHAAIELIPPSGALRLAHDAHQCYFQLLSTRRDILIPAAFRSGRCLILVNEAAPHEVWESLPKLSTRYSPVWPTARDLAEEIMQKCPMTANGRETTRLGWALTESWIDNYKYLHQVLIREMPQGTPSMSPKDSDMVHIQGEFGGMYNLYEAPRPRLRPILSSGPLGPPLQWGHKGLSSSRNRKNRTPLSHGSGTVDADPSLQSRSNMEATPS